MPPTIRALLLTDVVDSTKLSESLGDARMAQAWAAHDRVARDLLVLHRGREIDKTDGFLLLFETAADATAYALAYHRAIAALDPPMRARAGLHVGEVILTENAPADVARGAKPLEVDGLAKPVAARVMSAALGGQTLVTEQARAALGTTTLRLESRGHWRLKGLVDPIELFEAGDESSPWQPPPDGAKVYRVIRSGDLWQPAKQVRHGLPAERDAFVGRRSDLVDLARRIDDGVRLVSVLGIGGTGKTRLATRFAWTWLGDFPGGAWFCDLSEARGVEGICSAVARALDVPLGKEDPVVQLGHAIAGRGKCLVILDNFEQVARHAPETLGKWLDRASEAQFIVTTREVLGLPGEASLALPPLREDEAVELFVARAVQAKRDFALTDADRPHVQALVKLLDYLPLAIELAASRVRVMPPKTLLQRMSERFKLLTSSGGRHTRQATLRATLDWSWEMLSPDEQQALAQLSVFEGGFTLESAEAVLSLAEAWPADAVQSLVDKSLVLRVSDERFDLLVSVQEYAAERLESLGGRADAEQRHGAHFATLGTEEALGALETHGGVARRRVLVLELENIVAACRRAAGRGDSTVAVATLGAAASVVDAKRPLLLAAELGRQVLGLATLSRAERGRALRRVGAALQPAGRTDEARTCFEEALAIAREDGNRGGEGSVLCRLGSLHAEQGRMEEALRHYHESLAIAREVGSRVDEGQVLAGLGILHWSQGQMEEALRHYHEALAIAREVGSRVREGQVLAGLGIPHWSQGRMEEALRHYHEALAIAREVGSRVGEGQLLGNIGSLHYNQGRSDEALRYYREALAVHREVGNRRLEGLQLGNLGLLHMIQGHGDEARKCFEEALAIAREVGNRSSAGRVLGFLGTLCRTEGRMEDAVRHQQEALAIAREVGNRHVEGIVLSELGILHAEQGRTEEARGALDAGEALLRVVGDPLARGFLVCGRARLEHAEGRSDAARVALAEAESIAAEVGAGPDSALVREIAVARARLDGGSAPSAG